MQITGTSAAGTLMLTLLASMAWVVSGLAIDAVLYRRQRWFLENGAASPAARHSGEQRARQRLGNRLADVATLFGGLLLLAMSGWLVDARPWWFDWCGALVLLILCRIARTAVAVRIDCRPWARALHHAVGPTIRLIAAGFIMALVASRTTGDLRWMAGATAWLAAAATWRFGARWLSAPAGRASTTLDEGGLLDAVRRMAADSGLPGCAVRVVETGPGAGVVGARVDGTGRRRCVWLTRALMDRLSPKAVLAVIAHEMGHARLGHIERYDRRRAVTTWLYLALGGTLLQMAWPAAGAPIVTLVLYLAIGPAGWPAGPWLAVFRRRCEFEADDFAADRVGSAVLSATLADLFSVNAHRAGLDPLYYRYYATHPTDAARLTALRHRTS